MRKSSGFFLVFIVLFWFSHLWATSQKADVKTEGKDKDKKSGIKVEKAESIELQPLLKGMTFVRIRCQFNNVLYYQGYRNPRETKKEEFNLNKITNLFKEASIPITKNHIQKLYGRLETELKDNGVRIVDIQTTKESDSTVIPTITLVIDILATTPESYFIALDLTATQWMSYWANEESIQAPAIVWWQKKMATATTKDLIDTLNKSASALLENFTTQLTYANAKTAEEAKPTAEPTPQKKETQKTSGTQKKKHKKKR
jgi:hypothetical protein